MATAPDHPLGKYRQKRYFGRTPEPVGDMEDATEGRSFVVQKHAAGRLHYDFRLEIGGVLASWALPKGPSYDPVDKRIAVHVEDHPLAYGAFEGVIPPKQYGAGSMIVWDNGTWEPVGDPAAGLKAGKILFKLHGQKLAGTWELVRIAKPGEKQDLWILFKKRDSHARPKAEYDVLRALPDSVIARPLASAANRRDSAGQKSSKVAAHQLDGARKAAQPEKLPPQLATLSSGVPTFGRWVYEIKFDGYRIMCRIRNGLVQLITRGGHDWSAKMPVLVQELKTLDLRSAWLDGEIVVLGENGLPSFNGLQKAFDSKAVGATIDYFLFDVPYLDGYDLRGAALTERRALLQGMIERTTSSHLRFSAEFTGEPATILQSACRMGLEGLIAKREDSGYASARTDAWLKLKCRLRQEFVVCGYTDRSDGSPQIGSLLLGVYSDNGELASVGSVGTGWDAAEAATLKKKLAKLEIATASFDVGAPKPGRWSRRAAGTERWVKPVLVAEVQYGDMTPDGQIRHASYVALRSDKDAASVRKETMPPAMANIPMRRVGAASASAVRITHGDRVIDTSTGLTKLDLVRYYESVAEFILPHLMGRPCSLVRGPTGVEGQLFFQKHSERTSIPGLKIMDPALWPGHEALLEVASAEALAGAAQMNVIEFHTWNSTQKRIDAPDRLVFDLDPGDGTSWAHVQEAALLVRSFLQELSLESWLKTSGGKGLHVVVPVTPKLDYGSVKSFSQAIVQHLARVIPSRFVAKSGPANRIGKLFVDYLRNGHGATTAAAFSARARPGLGVSMPVAWEDLTKIKSAQHWTITNAREHLSFQTVDPWAGYWKKRQSLGAAMKTLGFTPRSAAEAP
jgi:bifunctional non-homologous end joining protein LigD